MWEQLFEFMGFLCRKIASNPKEMHFDIEMDIDLYKFCNQIGFITDDGIFKFKGRTFVLC